MDDQKGGLGASRQNDSTLLRPARALSVDAGQLIRGTFRSILNEWVTDNKMP